MRLDKVVVLLVDTLKPLPPRALMIRLCSSSRRNMPPAGYKVVEFVVRRIRYADDALCCALAPHYRKMAAPVPRDVGQGKSRCGWLQQFQAFVLAARLAVPNPHVSATNVHALGKTEPGHNRHVFQDGAAKRRMFRMIGSGDALFPANRVQVQSTTAGALADFKPRDVPSGLSDGLKVFIGNPYARCVPDDRVEVVPQPS